MSLLSLCSELILSTQKYTDMLSEKTRLELSKAFAALSGIDALHDSNLSLIETETGSLTLLDKLAENATNVKILSLIATDSLRVVIDNT